MLHNFREERYLFRKLFQLFITGGSTFETDILRQPDAERRISSKLVPVRQPGGAIQSSRDVAFSC